MKYLSTNYTTGDQVIEYQGVKFERKFGGDWLYNGKPCTKDMSDILETHYEDDRQEASKYQAIV